MRYARYEAAAEAGPYQRYRDILAAGLRGVAGELGFEPIGRGAGDVRGFGRRLAGLPRFGRRAGAPQDALPARGHHELRRRPVRGIEQAPGRRLRLDRHGPAGRGVQAGRAQLPSRLRAHRPAARAASCMSPRACSTITCRHNGWASRRSGSIGATTGRVRGRRRAPRRGRTRRSRTWRRSPRPRSADD